MTALAETGTFSLLRADDPADAARWLAAWERWPEREVFAHPAYVRLDARDGDGGHAMAALLELDGTTVLYPFILRDLQVEPWWTPDVGPATDIISPYGYGGPSVWGGSDDERVAEAFWSSFDAWASEAHVVSEFVRFALPPARLLAYPGTRTERAPNVVRSLQLEPEALWSDFEHKVRKNVKKAQRSGVRVEMDPRGARLGDFLRIYRDTMHRRGATSTYDFPAEYFERIRDELAGSFVFAHALVVDHVVSTELVLVSATRIYSFLGGTDAEAFDLRPNDLLKHEIMRWGREAGKLEYVLGGGYQRDDGIFRYKRAFAPDGVVPFHTGSRILRPETYDALTRGAAEGAAESGYFPAYRKR